VRIRSRGKRGRSIEVDRVFDVPADEEKSYTPEYHEARKYLAFAQNVYAHDESPEARRTIANALDAVQAEEEISEAARRRGYNPAQMTKADWSDLSDSLVEQAKEELHYASQLDRESYGHSLPSSI
jgi:hypothetical protein